MFIHQPINSKGNFNYNAFIYVNGSWKPHFHANYELIYIFDGDLEVKLNNYSITLRKSELLLINPNVLHAFYTKNSSRFWVGVFSSDFINSFAKRNEFVAYSKFKCDSEAEAFLKNHLFIEGEQDKYLTIACLNLVCSQCKKNSEEIESLKISDKLNDILKYISSHFSEKISLSDMASKLGYEYHYLSSLFNSYFDMNFKAYVNLYRFQHACELLTNTDKDIIEIAYESGFQTLRNFNRIFKLLSGHTPSSYRKESANIK